jgi:hypothetical protein
VGVKHAGGGRKIYLGGTSRTSARGQRAVNVVGSARPEVGDLVSTSGAFSGRRTGITVTSVNVEWTASTVDGVQERVFGDEAIKQNGSNAAGKGDSGGPVYIMGRGGVDAVGLVSRGAGHKTACTGLLESGVDFPLMVSILHDGNFALNRV